VDHRRIIRTLDYVSAAMLGLGLAITAASLVLTVGGVLVAAASAGKLAEVWPVLFPSLVITVPVVGLLVAMLVLCLLAARETARGSGRTLQTVVAILSLGSFPLGTAFGAYCLWALWLHPPIASTYPQGDRGRIAALMLGVGGITLAAIAAGVAGAVMSVLAVVPIDPDRLADRTAPIEERSGRVLRPDHCGLTQQATGSGCADLHTTFDEIEVSFASRHPDKGLTALRGTLSRPLDADGQPMTGRPAAVIVHGSGPNLRDGASPGDLIARYAEPFPMYRALAHELAAHGVVVLRYDKRTTSAYGEAVDFSQFAFWDLVDDARDGLDALAQRPEVDPEALVVVGHSQGGQLAPHVATDQPGIAAVVLLGGSTETLGHLIGDQLERLAEVRREQGDLLTGWMMPLNTWSTRRCFEPIWDGTYDPDAVCLGGVTQQAFADYEAFAGQTAAVLAALEVPVFAIQGTCDINIDPGEIARMAEILKGRDAELHLVHGLDHSLTSCVAPLDPVALDAGAMERLHTFLASVGHAPRGLASDP
jgi:pimeloyl-ACP methyl ester carboxylesterase